MASHLPALLAAAVRASLTSILPVAMVAVATSLPAQTLTRLLDLNRQPAGTVNLGSDWRPLGVVPTDPPTLYFSAFTEATGRELWKTQGTPETTQLVVDFVPGPGSSDPGPVAVVPGPASSNDVILPLTDVERRRTLCVVFGSGGVTTVPDADPWQVGAAFSRLVEWNSDLWFVKTRPTIGGLVEVALQRTDGSSVTEVARLGRGPATAPLLMRWRAGLAVVFDHQDFGRELWLSDGTATGTVLVADLVPGAGSSDPAWLTEFQGDLYMAALVPGAGRELVKTDGATLGLAADIAPGAADSAPEQLLVAGGRLFFSADDGLRGREPGFANPDGTVGVFDLNPGNASSDPRGFVQFADELWFTAGDALRQREFVALDPASPSTPRWPFDLNLSGDGPGGDFVTVCGDLGPRRRIVFAGTDGQSGEQLWATDGTALGTERLTDYRLGNGGARPRRPACLGGQVIFAADDDTNDDELHRSDGTRAGTAPLKDVNGATTATRGSAVQGFTEFRGRTYFMASDGLTGGELWETDGTAAGTRRLTDVLPGLTSLQIRDVRALGDVLFMSANNPLTVGVEPHVFDPRTGQLTVLVDIDPGPGGSHPHLVSQPIRVPTAYSPPLVFFGAFDPINGVEPWRSDGTTAGTFALGNVNPTLDSYPFSFVGPLRSGGGSVVLFGAVGAEGSELWRTSGGRGDAQLVLDIMPGPASSSPRYLTLFRGLVYMQASSPGDGAELWRSDGTALGTVQVIDIDDRQGSSPRYLTVFGDRLYFAARHRDVGEELWSSDGTRVGTTLLRDVAPGPAESSPRDLTVAGRRLFFTALNSRRERVLWVTDGSSSNVQAVPGPLNPKLLTAVGNKVYFVAGTGGDPADEEFWISDGTPDGTLRTDVHRGPRTSGITELRAANSAVWVRANDGVTGDEPYVVLDTGASATPIGTPCGGDGTTLAALPPELGTTISLTHDFAAAGHLAWTVIGIPARTPLQVGACSAPIDPGVLLVAGAFDTGAGGSVSLPVPIPEQHGLLGARVVAWTLFVDPGTSTWSASNALLLVLGR